MILHSFLLIKLLSYFLISCVTFSSGYNKACIHIILKLSFKRTSITSMLSKYNFFFWPHITWLLNNLQTCWWHFTSLSIFFYQKEKTKNIFLSLGTILCHWPLLLNLLIPSILRDLYNCCVLDLVFSLIFS